jgi:hypothetical protein
VTRRENALRAWRFQRPAWIPIASGYPPLLWNTCDPDELESIMVDHPILFPGYVRGTVDRVARRPELIAGSPYVDGWGCTWETTFTGMVGQVTEHALADWAAFEGLRPPDPGRSDGMHAVDWDALRAAAAARRRDGSLFGLYLTHGHTYMRLVDLRGFERFLLDMVDDEPRLPRLVRTIETFNLDLLHRFADLEPDFVGIPEDLGMQDRLAISPALFRKWIKPSYLAMTRFLKGRGILVHEHSDGHIMEIVDDLVECGGDVLNLQDLVNGIDDIARAVKGRMAIDLDLDRQSVTVTGTPRDIDDHVRECVTRLGSPAGGLSLCYSPWPPTPARNIRAVYDAMEKYCTWGGFDGHA